MYYVYILQNKVKSFHYIGLTHSLHNRLAEHTKGSVPVTKGYLPLKLVWYCVFQDKLQAAAFEHYLKSGSGRAFAKKHLVYSP